MTTPETPSPAAGADEPVVGTSLWKDAWRRLRRNRLALAGAGVMAVIVTASLIGPPIIEYTTGYTYDYIPEDRDLIRSLPPFTAPDGSSPGSIQWARTWRAAICSPAFCSAGASPSWSA